MIFFKPGKCPSCGSMKTEPKCSHCGQSAPLEHDTRICQCGACVATREHEDDLRGGDLGISMLARMKAIRREDEARRKEMGLPPPQTGGGSTITVSNPQTYKMCKKCGHLCGEEFNFCTNCGTRF